MDVKTFCTYMRDEMGAWKARTQDLAQQMEKMWPEPDEERAASMDQMGAMIHKMEKMIESLERECPAHWDREKADLEAMICDMRERWTAASETSPDDFE